MSEQMTPEERTCRIAVEAERMKQAETRHEQEQVLAELERLVRTPTTTFFGEGL